jgi:hypothetical protein
MTMIEKWKDIEGYEGRYQVSNQGRIKSLPRKLWNGEGWFDYKGKIIIPRIDNNGYPIVTLSTHSKGKRFRVHRLVAKAFIPNPNGYTVVNHIDCNTTNNNVNNLEWCTQKHNVQYAVKKGAFNKYMKRVKVLETGEIYSSIHECAREMAEYNVDFRHVSACLKGKLKSHAGFHFVALIEGLNNTVAELEDIVGEMCHAYCKMPHEACDQNELDELCKYCPLNNFFKEVTINE